MKLLLAGAVLLLVLFWLLRFVAPARSYRARCKNCSFVYSSMDLEEVKAAATFTTSRAGRRVRGIRSSSRRGDDFMIRRGREERTKMFTKKESPKKKAKVRVRLRVGEDPSVWDEETGEEITKKVNEIRLMPGKRSVAILDRRTDLDGELVHTEADVVRIEGVWVAPSQPKPAA